MSQQHCLQCEQLRRKGKFPKKCIHSSQRQRTNSSPPISPKEHKSEEISSSSNVLPKVPSLSKIFPEIGNYVKPSFYSGLRESDPTRCEVECYKLGRAKIQIAVFEIPGALLVVTGLFTSYKLNIRRGSVLRKKQERVIIALFDVSFETFDVNQQEFFKLELNELWNVLKVNRNDAVKRLLLKTIVNPSGSIVKSSNIKKLNFSVGNSDEEDTNIILSDSEGNMSYHSDSSLEDGISAHAVLKQIGSIPCSVRAEDTIGFLFFLSTALTLRDIDIDGIIVDGDEVSVNDLFFLSPNQVHNASSSSENSWTLKDEIQTAVSVLQNFTQVLSHAPDPSQALRNFDKLLSTLERNSMMSEVHQMMHEQMLKRLALILGSSSFLWEGFLQTRYSENINVLKDDIPTLESKILTKEQYAQKLLNFIEKQCANESCVDLLEETAAAFSSFKSKELFRIYVKHLVTPNILAFSADLNALAEAMVHCAIEMSKKFMESNKTASWPTNSNGIPFRLAICGLGKFGGKEMGFASDLDMICIYDSQENTEDSFAASVYFPEFMRVFLKLFLDRSRLGSAFDIDLRLRPHGSLGLEASSFAQFKNYYSKLGEAQQFERQALIRLRFVAGDADLGRDVEDARDSYTYSSEPLDLSTAIHLRQRQRIELCNVGKVNVKYGVGGIIDIEYGVQYLQLKFGQSYLKLRKSNIPDALRDLAQLDILKKEVYQVVYDSYVMIRHLIDALRLVRGNASDLDLPLLDPKDPDFISLAKRLGNWNDNSSYPELIGKIQNSLCISSAFYEQVVINIRNSISQIPFKIEKLI